MNSARIEALVTEMVISAFGGPGSGPQGGSGGKIDHKSIAKHLRDRADNLKKAGLNPGLERQMREAAATHDRLSNLNPDATGPKVPL